MWVVTTVVPVGKHWNRCSQMFYKIDAFKNLAILTGKHLCWRFFSINFIKKRLQYWCFPASIPKCLSTAFYTEHFVSIHFTFQNIYAMIEFFWFFRYKIDIFHISCATVLFSFITWKPIVISYLSCFYIKILIKCNFCTDYNDGFFTILIDSLKFRNNSRKIWIWVFLNITLCYHFSLAAFLRGMAKNNPTKNKSKQKL